MTISKRKKGNTTMKDIPEEQEEAVDSSSEEQEEIGKDVEGKKGRSIGTGKGKIQRQSYSCAECKRLKLKCSRTWPCTSCEKRGCAQICPNGTIRTGKGKRLILADTEELHQRISALEVALAQAHARQSTQPHPLLSSTYLFSPRDTARPRPGFNAESTESEIRAPGLEGPEEDVVDSAFGTLTIGQGGEARFVGSFAGSEYLKEAENDEDEGEVKGMGLGTGLPTPPDTAVSISGFRFGPPQERNGPTAPGIRIGGYMEGVDVDGLKGMLPDWEEGRELVQNYWDNVSWMYQVIPRHLIEQQFLIPAYDANQSVHPHKLAVVFLVMALGVMFDLHRPPFDNRGSDLFALGQKCLSAVGMEHATPSTVRALHLCGTYVLNDKHGSGAEIFWPVLGTAVKVAYSLGLHRDGSIFNLSPEETEERRMVWWDLVTYDRLQATCFARPAGIASRSTDTKMPTQDERDPENFHLTKYRIVELLEKVIDVQTQVTPVPYSLVKSLDSELVEFKRSIPAALLPSTPIPALPLDPTVPPHLVIHRLTLRLMIAQCRLLLSRPFFARALSENPDDPSFSKHGASFTALYEAAQEIVQVVQRLVVYHPSLVSRWWYFWFHGFSSACCFAAIAIRAPTSAFATPAFEGLTTMYDIAIASREGCRAKKGLPVLMRLRARAQDAMRKAGRYGSINASSRPNQPGRMASYVPHHRGNDEVIDGEDDDLGHLTGKSRLRRVKESHVRSGSASTGSEHTTGSGANQVSPTMFQIPLYSPPITTGAGNHDGNRAFTTEFGGGGMIAPGVYGGNIGGPSGFEDFMVSPGARSVGSAATSVTLAEKAWEGVVPPPPPPLDTSMIGAGPSNGGWAGMGGNLTANSASPLQGFSTLLSGMQYSNYTQTPGTVYTSLSSTGTNNGNGNNNGQIIDPSLWTPPITTSSFASNHNSNPDYSGGGNFDFSALFNENDGNNDQAIMQDFGMDMDMTMALGIGEGLGGSAGEWDWDSILNGNMNFG